MSRIKLAVIMFFIIFIASLASTWAINEDNVVSSTEEIVGQWEELLSKNVNIVGFDQGDAIWLVYRPILLEGSFGYDIKKTDSIVSPYQLIMSFKAEIYKNVDSPNANSVYKSTQKKGGFKTAEDALAHTKSTDFSKIPKGLPKPLQEKFLKLPPLDMKIYYALQKGEWVFKNGNDVFNRFIGINMSIQENTHLFKDLFKIPVK